MAVSQRILGAFLAVLLTACAGTPPEQKPPETPSTPQQPVPVIDPVDALLEQADASHGAEADRLRIRAAALLLDDGELARAESILATIARPPADGAETYWLLRAEIALALKDPVTAEQAALKLDKVRHQPENLTRLKTVQADVALFQGRGVDAARLRFDLLNMAPDAGQRSAAATTLLATLGQTAFSELSKAAEPDNSEWEMWRSLALIIRNMRIDVSEQREQLAAWKARHAGARHRNEAFTIADQYSEQLQPVQRIALLMPQGARSSGSADAVIAGFLAEQYAARDRNEPSPEVRIFDTDTVGSLQELSDALSAFAPQLVIGPLLKDRLAELTPTLLPDVPMLTLNFDETGSRRPDTLQFGLNQDDELRQLARLARQRPRAIFITADSTAASAASATLTSLWRGQGGEVINLLSFNDINDYREALEQSLNIAQSEERRRALSGVTGIRLQSRVRRRQDIDQFVIIAEAEAARAIKPLLAFTWAGDIPVAASSMAYSARADGNFDQDLEDVQFVDLPIFSSAEQPLRDALHVADTKPGPSDRLAALGADAWRLQQRFRALQWMPQLGLTGATGELSLDERSRIHRRGSWYRFDNGKVVLAKRIP